MSSEVQKRECWKRKVTKGVAFRFHPYFIVPICISFYLLVPFYKSDTWTGIFKNYYFSFSSFLAVGILYGVTANSLMSSRFLNLDNLITHREIISRI
jgi:hypothetical protein